jgi:secondary thiamine-phosphate synthase enzyme
LKRHCFGASTSTRPQRVKRNDAARAQGAYAPSGFGAPTGNRGAWRGNSCRGLRLKRDLDGKNITRGRGKTAGPSYLKQDLALGAQKRVRQSTDILTIVTKGRGFVDITDNIVSALTGTGIKTGLLTLFCRHTSASLLIQENADPAVLADLEAWFERTAPEERDRYRHDAEGPDDMPSHIRTALTATSLAIPVVGGGLALGTWQAVYLVEHRRNPHRREVALHLIGD